MFVLIVKWKELNSLELIEFNIWNKQISAVKNAQAHALSQFVNTHNLCKARTEFGIVDHRPNNYLIETEFVCTFDFIRPSGSDYSFRLHFVSNWQSNGQPFYIN